MRRKIQDFFTALMIWGFILLLVALVVGIPIYQFSQCKSVGFSTLYCILDMGKK